jgi:hypothetical protein
MPERSCPSETLKCKLEDVSDFYNRVLLDSKSEQFSGINQDEPSIAPDRCTMKLDVTSPKGQSYVVSFDDRDYAASVYGMKDGVSTSFDTATFTVTKGKKFYYQHGTELLSCELSQ